MQDIHRIHRITDQITLVVLGVNIWSGRKKLRPEVEKADDLPRALPAVEEKEDEERLAVDDGGGFFF